MAIFSSVLLVLQIGAALAMIGLILLQHGKGADMGAAFGSGSSGSLFGASGSANFLSRSTAVAATVFLASTLALTYLGDARRGGAAAGSGSVLNAPITAPVQPASSASESAATIQPPAAPASGVSGIPQ